MCAWRIVGFLAPVIVGTGPQIECPEPQWKAHQLEVIDAEATSAINSTNLPGSFFGVEGGHIILAGGSLYTIITEFYSPPLWVPSRIALWRGARMSPWPTRLERVQTLFTSGGKTDCRDPRASLGSSASIVLNETTGHYEVFYVGFKSCNDSAFVNRQGRIFRAVAQASGVAGLALPFEDKGIVLAPSSFSQPWEGTQGVDSMQPYSLGAGKGWAAFYGSAGVTPSGTNNGQRVGLAFAPSLAGPWTRQRNGRNPVNLSAQIPHIEQPIVSKLADGTFAAVFDALTAEGRGMVGYSWSSDGTTWHPGCSQILDVLNRSLPGGGATWAATGAARTPQGLLQLPNSSGDLLLSFSAYDYMLPPHYHLPSQKGRADNYHESMGFARLRFRTESR